MQKSTGNFIKYKMKAQFMLQLSKMWYTHNEEH